MRYIDPNGLKYCDSSDPDDCTPLSNSIEHTAIRYRIRLRGSLTDRDRLAIVEAAESTGARIASERGLGETADEAFRAIYNSITIVGVTNYEYLGDTYEDGCKTEASTITCADITYGYFQSTVNNIVHELGHVFDQGPGIPQVFIDNRETILHDNDETGMWKLNPAPKPRETFGDFFVAWVFGVWGPDADTVWPKNPNIGSARDWMNIHMQVSIQP